MKSLRIKHYGYVVLTALLFIVSSIGILTNLKSAKAEVSEVTITSPTANQKLAQKDQTITGNAPALKKLRVFDGNKKIGETTSDVNGHWSIAWKKIIPGKHSLNAYLVDGDIYKPYPYSVNSIQVQNVNSGETEKNYKAGLAMPVVVAYDSPHNTVFAFNRINHSISVVNASTKTLVNTITYATDDALTGTEFDQTGCRCNNQAYYYDEQTQLLYILDLERIYAISTESNQVIKTINVDMPVDSSEFSSGDLPTYKLYVDPQHNYVYFYVSDKVYSEQPIQRYSTDTGQKDNSWDQTGSAVVGGPGGDVYFINKTSTTETDVAKSYLYKYEADDSQVSLVDLSSLCQTADSNNLAVSTDQNSVYVGCFDGPGTNFPSKQIAVSTSDLTLTDLNITNTDNARWMTEGNLKANKLILIAPSTPTTEELESGNVTYTANIVSVNTADNSLQPSVALGSHSNAYTGLEDSLVVSDSDWFSVSYSDSNTQNNVTMVINKTNNAVLNTFENSYDSTKFAGIAKAYQAGTDQIVIDPILPQTSLQFQDTATTGTITAFQSGAGFGMKTFSSKSTNRLFSTAGFASAGSDFVSPGSNSVTVSDLQNGNYESTISINTQMIIVGGIMNASGSKLYLFAVDLEDTTNLTVYRLDTQTLTIDKTYDSFSVAGDNMWLLISDNFNTFIVNDELIFGTDTKVYLLNLVEGSVRTYDTDQLSIGSGFGGLVLTVDPQGKYFAVLGIDAGSIKIIKISDLSLQKTIAVTANNVTTISFTQDGKLIAGNFYHYISRIDPETGKVEKINTKFFSEITGVENTGTVCILEDVKYASSGNYMEGNVLCLGEPGEDGLFQHVSKYLVIFNPENLTILNKSKLYESSDVYLSGDPSIFYLNYINAENTDISISKASQDVTVVADTVSILNPEVGQKLSKGEYTITGTAAPNQTIDILADTTKISTVTANQYGYWQKKTVFSGSEKKLTAQFTVAKHDVVYLSKLSADIQSGEIKSAIQVLNESTGLIEKTLSLSNGMFSPYSVLNKAKTKLYTIGATGTINTETGEQNFTSINLYAYSTKTSKLIYKSPNLGFFDVNTAGTGAIVTPFTLSSDEKSLYLSTNTELLKVSIASGNIIKSYNLGQEYADAANDADAGVNLLGLQPPTLMESRDGALVVYPNKHGVVLVDMKTSGILQFSTPEGVSIVKGLISDKTSQLFSMITFQDGPSQVTAISGISLDNFQSQWTFTPEGYVGFAPDMIFNPDQSELIITGAHINNDNFESSVLKINTSDGTADAINLQPDDATLSVITHITSVADLLSIKLAVNNSGNRIYSSLSNLSSGSIVTVFDQVANSQKIAYSTLSDDPGSASYAFLFNGSISNDFVKTVPTTKVSAERSILFNVDSGTNNPPVLPPATNPQPNKPPIAHIGNVIKKNIKKIKAVNIEPAKKSPIESFIAKLFAATRRFVVSVPLPLVNAFPYLLFLSLMSLIGYYLYQTQNQLRREDGLRNIYEKQKVLAEEKRNFLELSSHYLRTPLTYIKAGSEMILRNQQNEAAAAELSQSVGHLSLFIESLIEEAGSNEQLQEIIEPQQKLWSPLLQKSFWLPVAGFVVALGLFYLIFGIVGGVNFGPARYVTQILLMFIIVQVFYGMFKNHRGILHEERILSKTINAEASLDHARAKLMQDAGAQLQTRTDHLGGVISKLQSVDTSKAIMQQGVDRLKELSQAFMLVSKLEADVMEGKIEPVSIRAMAADVIEPLADQLKAKKVKVEVSGFDQDIMLNTNRPLAELTLKTLLENALQASSEGSSLVVKCLHKDGRLAFQVIDHGAGIPKDKIERLFKPFVRVGPVTTFNREGIGLSLYLDRLIMHSLGGEIEIISRFKKGTTATLTFNQDAVS